MVMVFITIFLNGIINILTLWRHITYKTDNASLNKLISKHILETAHSSDTTHSLYVFVTTQRGITFIFLYTDLVRIFTGASANMY
jgi:hypothetical protein